MLKQLFPSSPVSTLGNFPPDRNRHEGHFFIVVMSQNVLMAKETFLSITVRRKLS